MSPLSGTKQESKQSGSLGTVIVPLLAISMGMFMIILDTTAVTIIIPRLGGAFQSPLSVVQWAVTGYSLALAAVIPLAGWVSDRFGAKQVFLTSIGLFTLGSVLCSYATGVEQLIVFRVIQGLGGGMVAPIAFALIYQLSPPEKVGKVMALLGIPTLVAPAVGPILAGSIAQYMGWPWVFLINLPIGIIAIAFGLRAVPKSEQKTVPALDLPGVLLAPVAFAALAYGVNEGIDGWTSISTLTGLIVGTIAFVLFVMTELRHKQPLLDLSVFRSADFRRSTTTAWIGQLALSGVLFLIPISLQVVEGLSSSRAGIVMLPVPIACGVFMQISGPVFDRVGARPVVVAGLAMVATGTFLFARVGTGPDIRATILPLALIGAGMGSSMPVNTHILQTAPFHLASRVSSLINAAQQVMNSLAVAGATTILALRTAHYGAGPLSARAYGDTYLVTAAVALTAALAGLSLRRPDPSRSRMEAGELSATM